MVPVPRSLALALDQLKRDASRIAGRLAGNNPPPFTSRPREARPVRVDDATARLSSLLAPRTVRVARIVRETPDAVSLVFEDPSGAPISFLPGQFFTLLVSVDGGEVLKRAYSASSDARDTGRVAVTVKRDRVGDRLEPRDRSRAREGDLLQVLGPSGELSTPPARAEGDRHPRPSRRREAGSRR